MKRLLVALVAGFSMACAANPVKENIGLYGGHVADIEAMTMRAPQKFS